MAKIKYINIAYLFVILFPIMPSYFEIGGVAVINLLCVLIILSKISTGVHKTIKFDSIDKIFIFFWLLWETIVCFLHGSFTDAIIILLYIFAVIAVAGSIKTLDQFNRVIDYMLYTAGVISIFGLIESVTGFNIFSILNTSGTALNYNPPRFGLTRIISSSGHTIEYCSYCMMCLALAFYRIVNLKKSRKRNTFLLVYALIFSNALLTLSRSALICLMICQVLLLYASGFSNFLKTMLKVLIGIVIATSIISVVVPEVEKAIQEIVFMFLAIFSDNYKTLIASSFGNDNLSAFGNRFDLFGWVWNDMKGHYLLGIGPDKGFNHAFTEYSGGYSWTTVKNSIEVNYLNILWKYGIITLGLELACAVKIVIHEMKMKKNNTEGKLSFGKTCGIVSICYLAIWLAIAQGTEYKMFIMITALFFVYIRITRQADINNSTIK